MRINRILPVSLMLALSPFSVYSGESASAVQLAEAGSESVPPSAPSATPDLLRSQGRDVTAEYKALYSEDAPSRDLAALTKLKGYKVLFVPGFLAEANIKPIVLPWGGEYQGKYFDEQMAWLTNIGIENQRIAMEYQAAVPVNAKIVAAAIEASDKPVILIAHSKGGLDLLEALIKNRALVGKVRGIITFQTPYYGSPVADYVMRHGVLSDLAVNLLLKMGGTKEAMQNLGTAERSEYLRNNAQAIAEITAAVPVLTLATWKDREHHKLDTSLKPFRDEMLEHGIKSDGVVPLDSAALPGADFVKLDGLDHGVTVRESKTIPLDRIKLTKSFLIMALSR